MKCSPWVFFGGEMWGLGSALDAGHEWGVFMFIQLLTFMLLRNQKQPRHPVLSSNRVSFMLLCLRLQTWGLNAYFTSGAPQLLTVNIIQPYLTCSFSPESTAEEKPLEQTTQASGFATVWHDWQEVDVFILLREKKEVLLKTSDPSVLLNLLRILIDQCSQKVRATIKGFVRSRVATKEGKSCSYLDGGDGGLLVHLRYSSSLGKRKKTGS